MPTVVFITPEFFPFVGGTANATLGLAQQFTRFGYRVHIVSHTLLTEGSPLHEQIDSIEVHRIWLPPLRVVCMLWFFLKSLLVSFRLKPDIIYGQMLYPSGLISGLYGILSRKRSIVHARGADVNEILLGKCSVEKKLSLLALKLNRFVFTLSQDHRKKIAQYTSKKIFCVPNGVDLPVVKLSKKACRKKFGFIRDHFHLLYVGRLLEWKGLSVLLKALAKSPGCFLHIVGEGPERKTLNILARDIGVSKKLKFYGKLPRSSVLQMMKAADCFTYPEFRGQGLANATLEAMASGLTIIGSDIGYFKDIITHGKNGFLIKPGNVLELSHHIQLLKSNPKLKKRLAQNALMLIRQKYGWDKIVENIEQIIRP